MSVNNIKKKWIWGLGVQSQGDRGVLSASQASDLRGCIGGRVGHQNRESGRGWFKGTC